MPTLRRNWVLIEVINGSPSINHRSTETAVMSKGSKILKELEYDADAIKTWWEKAEFTQDDYTIKAVKLPD